MKYMLQVPIIPNQNGQTNLLKYQKLCQFCTILELRMTQSKTFIKQLNVMLYKIKKSYEHYIIQQLAYCFMQSFSPAKQETSQDNN